MKKLIFTDVDGERIYQHDNGDLRNQRGTLLGLEHEANIRASLPIDWPSCTTAQLYEIEASGTYGQRLITRRYLQERKP